MKLATYLKRSKRSVTEFAEAIGADRARVYRWMKGTRRPDLDSAFIIERETRGAVPAVSWAETQKPQRAA